MLDFTPLQLGPEESELDVSAFMTTATRRGIYCCSKSFISISMMISITMDMSIRLSWEQSVDWQDMTMQR